MAPINSLVGVSQVQYVPSCWSILNPDSGATAGYPLPLPLALTLDHSQSGSRPSLSSNADTDQPHPCYIIVSDAPLSDLVLEPDASQYKTDDETDANASSNPTINVLGRIVKHLDPKFKIKFISEAEAQSARSSHLTEGPVQAQTASKVSERSEEGEGGAVSGKRTGFS